MKNTGQPPPTVLAGRFRLERALGAGGVVSVFLAEDTAQGRKVAVRLLREDSATAAEKAQFLHELAIVAQSHRPSEFDSGEDEGFLYCAVPYVEGVDVFARTPERPPAMYATQQQIRTLNTTRPKSRKFIGQVMALVAILIVIAWLLLRRH